MLTSQEIRRSVAGAWALFKGQAEGMRAFDLTIEGFWRSFLVFFLLLPPFAISVLAEQKLSIEHLKDFAQTTSDGLYFLVQLLGFSTDWVLMPALLAAFARTLDIEKTYLPFIIARNWSSLIAVIPYTVPAALYLLGVISSGSMIFLSLVAMAVILRYRYMIARIALETSGALAVGIVALDFILSLLIGSAISRLTGI